MSGTEAFGQYWDWAAYWLNYADTEGTHNAHVLFYEDLESNFAASVNALAKFLGKDVTADDISQLAMLCGKAAMRQKYKPVFANFIRKAHSGVWREELSKGQAERIDTESRKRFGDSKYLQKML